MGSSQLSLYNGALRLIKESRLSTTTDDIASRYLLDDVYTGAKAYVLEQGQWAWASVSTSVSGTASSNRGFSYRFTKPSDFVRLISISASSSYYPPHEAYAEDATYWYANDSTIYITYTSKYSASATVTMTIASPGVVTWTGHGLVAGDPIVFTTTGALPTSVTAGTTYYVLSTSITADTFSFAATPGGTAINTSGTQSGTHTGQGLSGGNLTKWPETYSKVVEAFLAMEIAPHLTNVPAIIGFAQESYDDALKIALAKDCINRTSRILTSGTLSVYNGALRLLKKRNLTNFDDRTIARRVYDASGEKGDRNQPGRPPSLPASDIEDEMVLRRLLDEAYDDAVEHLLADSLWNFASRTVAIESETDIEPVFGYNYVFEKPDDFIRLVAISDNGTLFPTLDEYTDEGQYWNANVDPLYVQYVSDGTSFGRDESLWPITFKKAVEAYLALEIAPSAGMSANAIAGLNEVDRQRLRDARGKDAANQAAMRTPPGRLVLARSGGTFRSTQRREN